MEDWAEIRRLSWSEGLSIKEIARPMGVVRNTVRTELRSGTPPGRKVGGAHRQRRRGGVAHRTQTTASDRGGPGRAREAPSPSRHVLPGDDRRP